MALNINGTTGISGVDGSASAPALQGSDSNTGVSFGTDTVNINTGGSTRATVDSSGNLGVGETSPLGKLHSKTSDSGGSAVSYANELVLENSSDGGMTILTGNNKDGSIAFGDDGNNVIGRIVYNHNVNAMHFNTNGSERMRLGSDGFVGIGVTSDVTASSGGTSFNVASDNRRKLVIGVTSASGRGLINFINSNGEVGGVATTGTSTAYNTSSDYRLKENVVPISDGITRLKTLKPSRFNFKTDVKTILDGFLAHEVTAVPEAITGTKDELVTQSLIDSGDKDQSELGNPVYQSIDQSKLVPLLTAALQEAIAKIEVLETKVAALEAA